MTSNLVIEKDRAVILFLDNLGTIYCNFLVLPTDSDDQFHFYSETIQSPKQNFLKKLKSVFFGSENIESMFLSSKSQLRLLKVQKKRDDVWKVSFADLLGSEIGLNIATISEDKIENGKLVRKVELETNQRIDFLEAVRYYETKNNLAKDDELVSLEILDTNFHLLAPKVLETLLAYKCVYKTQTGEIKTRIGLQILNLDWIVYLDELLFGLILFDFEEKVENVYFKISNLKSTF